MHTTIKFRYGHDEDLVFDLQFDTLREMARHIDNYIGHENIISIQFDLEKNRQERNTTP